MEIREGDDFKKLKWIFRLLLLIDKEEEDVEKIFAFYCFYNVGDLLVFSCCKMAYSLLFFNYIILLSIFLFFISLVWLLGVF